MKYFLFANLKVAIDPANFEIPDTVLSPLFEIEKPEKIDILFTFVEDSLEFVQTFKQVEYTGGYEIYDSENGYFIIFHWYSMRYAYGYYLNDIIYNQNVTIYANPKMHKYDPITYGDLLGNLSIHIFFLKRNVGVLHAAYIRVHDEAILFLGKSGTGKSTQATLWEEYADAEIINGDRTLISKIDGKWCASGFPACGSSSICKNITLPIKAFVVLEQAPFNSVEKMRIGQQITAIVAGCHVYPWMNEEMDRLFQFAGQIVQESNIIKLKCQANEEAVRVLMIELGG